MVSYAFDPVGMEQRALYEAEAWQARQQALQTMDLSGLGERIVELTQTWPDLPPGLVVGMAMSGIEPHSDAAAALEQRALEHASGIGFGDPGEVVDPRAELRREAQQEQERGLVGQGVDALKTGVRGAFMGMETAFEEVRRPVEAGLVALQDSDQDFGEAYGAARPSMGRMLASDEFGWEDLGDGWIPGGDIRQEQEELKHNLQLDGHWMSPGRALAINVTEPGTNAFNFTSGLIDAAFRVFGDPSTYALAGAGKLRQANRVFATDSTLIQGLRRTTSEQHAREWWLHSRPGQRLRESLVDEKSPYEVWQRLGGPQGKVDSETARLIAEASDFRHLDDVVIPRLGPQGIAEKPVGRSMISRGIGMATGSDLGAVHGMGIHLRRFTDDRVRLAQWLPDKTIETGTDRGMVTVDRFLKGIKADRRQRTDIMDRFLTAENPAQIYDTAIDMAEIGAQRALRDSLPRKADLSVGQQERAQEIKGMFQFWKDRAREDRNYFTVEAGRPGANIVTWEDGTSVDFAKVPHMVSEMLNREIPLPDMQFIRRHIGGYARTMRTLENVWEPLGLTRNAFETSVNLLGGAMSNIWKPLVLLRGAYIPRVGGEEQLRMGASGLDSLARNPLGFIMWQSGKRGRTWRDEDIKSLTEYTAILQRKGGGWFGRPGGSVGTDQWRVYRRGEPGVTDSMVSRAWAERMSRAANDDVHIQVSRNGVDWTTGWLRESGEGRKVLRQLGDSDDLRPILNSHENTRRYVQSVQDRIEELTRGNQDLTEAIATGRLDGMTIRGVHNTVDQLGPALRKRLDEVGIQEMSGQHFVVSGSRQGIMEPVNRTVDVLADYIMSKPTNWAARGPTWRQEFFRSVQDQLGFMDPATQQAALREMQKAGLSRAALRRAEKTVRAQRGSQITDLDSATSIAKAHATDRTRKLLYELTEHGQFSDMMRAAMPFAEAWKEIMVSWARIMRDRPQTWRRAQVSIDGARGSGFFHTDPSTGDEMFTYPGGHLVSRAMMSGNFDEGAGQALASIPVVGPMAMGAAGAFMDEQPAEFDLEGRVQGLNLFTGAIIPGLGPAVTIPAANIVPDRPSWDWVRDNLIFPFGEPDTDRGIASAVQPAWMQKFSQAMRDNPEADRIYAASVFDVAKALVATGEYSTNSPEEMERLMAASRQRAKTLWMVRGAAQFALPTGPEINFRVQDLEGQWWPYQVLTTEYHRLREEHGEQVATDEFIAAFGTDLHTLLQSKSRQIVPRPISKTGDDWIRENEDVATSYPLTVGFVAPDDPTGEFHFPAYQRQFDEGTRERLTPEQMVWLSNNAMGNMAYRHAIEGVDGNDQASAEMRARIRSELMEQYPGFNSHIGVSERPRVEHQVAELQRLVADERVADEPATEGIREYLRARQQANQWVETMAPRSTSFQSSRETAWIRRWLRGQAEAIAARNPSFIPAWERVFQREMADEELTEPGQTSG